MNTKLHFVPDAEGRPIGLIMSAISVIDYAGATALESSLPETGWILADKEDDNDWFRKCCK